MRKDWECTQGEPPGRSQWLVERREVLQEGSGYLSPDGALIIRLHMAVLTDETNDSLGTMPRAVETKQLAAEKQTLADFSALFE